MRVVFLSGIPRSGSTVFASVLAQNPAFKVTPTSGICELMMRVRNQFNDIESFRANPNEAGKERVLKGMLQAYHQDAFDTGKLVVDKSRGWLSCAEMLERILAHKVKFIVNTRNLQDVLASMEKLYRANSTTQMSQERAFPTEFSTIEGRCKVWADATQLVGASYNAVKDAIARGFKDRMFFVKYDEFTSTPEKVCKEVYKFLEEPYFQHNFQQVEQVFHELDELGYGIKDLHTIRPKIEPCVPQWPTVLGDAAKPYANQEVW